MTGKINGDTYQNDFFGVKYTLPAGYKYYNEQELAEMNGVSAGTDPSEVISKGALYSDAVAYKDDGSNVIFGIQYEPQGASYSADAYADESLKQLKSQLAAGGITLVDSQKGEYTHGASGAKYPAIRLKLEKDGTEYNEQMLFFKADPNYFFVVNATAANEADLDDMLCNVEQTK